MRRVFYFSGYRMKVFEWHGKTLLGHQDFEPDAEGHQLFADFLQQAVAMPAQLLVDIIEEDFRREFIPHVRGNDRKALLNRLLDRHYRGDQHVHVQNIGRQKDGRKDDIILLTAITNTELLTPWIKQLQEADIPLAGIWSLPLLSVRLLKPLKVKVPHVLVVSRQIKSALRETYFQKGKLIFSRQAKLDSDSRDDETAESLLKNLLRETDQTYRFLTNQRIMGFTETLNVVCIVPDALLADFKSQSVDANNVRYQFIPLQPLLKEIGFSDPDATQCDSLFAYYCAQAQLTPDHYATSPQKQSFYRFLIDRSIGLAASLGAILLLGGAALVGLHAMEVGQQINDADRGRQILQQRYQRDFSAAQFRLDDARLIEETVLLASRLQQEAEQAPQNFFPEISAILDDPRFAAIQLDRLEWQKISATDLERYKQIQNINSTDPNAYDDEYAYQDYQEPSRYPHPLINLGGSLDDAELSYRETVALMQQFIERLQNIPGTQQVFAVRMPVDVRPEQRFTDQGGVQATQRQDAGNGYELVMVMEPLRHE